MRKKISVKYLKSISACNSAILAFRDQKETNPIGVLKGSMKIDRFDWTNWLIVRLMNRKQKIEYSIFAVESVINLYEKKHPDDKRPRTAIEAVKKVLKRDSKKNRAAAAAAAAAAADAAYAADDAAAAAAAAAADAAYAAADAAYAAYAAAAAADAAARKKLQKKIINNGIKILKRK